jgi:prophage DNA circulation protein
LAPTPLRTRLENQPELADGSRTQGGSSALKTDAGALRDAAEIETLDLLRDLTAVFRSVEDMQTIEALAVLEQRIGETALERQQQAKEALAQLARSVEVSRQRAIPPEPEHLHQQRVEDREVSKRQIIERMLSDEERSRALQANLRELDAESTEVQQALDRYRQRIQTDIPSLKHALSLYVTISCIRWNYRCEQTQVEGYVARDRENDVRPFHFRHGDPVDTADRLWALIES